MSGGRRSRIPPPCRAERLQLKGLLPYTKIVTTYEFSERAETRRRSSCAPSSPVLLPPLQTKDQRLPTTLTRDAASPVALGRVADSAWSGQ